MYRMWDDNEDGVIDPEEFIKHYANQIRIIREDLDELNDRIQDSQTRAS